MRQIRNRLLSLAMALVLCISCIVPAISAEETISVAGSNMTLGNDLKMNFMVKTADIADGSYTAKVWHADREPVELSFTRYNNTYHCVSYSVAAKEMTDEIYIEVYNADGVLVSKPYSRNVVDYAMSLMTDQTADSLKSVVVDMLNYGTEAQKYFGYREDSYANATLTEEQQAYATADVPCSDNRVMGANFAGSNLSLESSILLNAFFGGVTASDLPNLTATCSFTNYLGVEQTDDCEVSMYGSTMAKVVVDKIVLADAKCMVNITLYKNGVEIGNCAESVESYVARSINDTMTGAINAAILKFARSAFLHLGGTDPKPEEIHNWNTGELVLPVTETTAGQALYTCLDDGCGETKTETIPAGTTVYTRADLEEALTEVAWDYALKKEKVQYDSEELDAMGKFYSGKFLLTENASPEAGTSHTDINSVCSDYVWKVYEEALNHNLLGVRSSLETTTSYMWLNAENQAYFSNEEDVDSVLVRWTTLEHSDLSKEWGLHESPHYVATKEEVFEYFFNWETMLRPGDVVVDKGHTIIFAGNGKMLHCNGLKYSPSSGVINREDNGAVYGMSPWECSNTSWMESRASTGRLMIFRPTEFLVTEDTDGDLGNDMVSDPNFVMPEDTLSRLEYPGMEIDRTINITPFGTASVGQELTYSIKISNLSNDSKYVAFKRVAEPGYAGVSYENLIVTETVPEGTELVSVTEGGVYDEETNTITWTLNIAAGKAVTPAYTVKVTGEIGDIIVCGGGFVADIPSNTISNRIGGKKLNEGSVESLADLAAGDTTNWDYSTDLAFAEEIYEEIGSELSLPTVVEIVEDLFVWTHTEGEIRGYTYESKGDVDVFMLREDADMSMIIPTYYGGYRFFTGSDAIGSTIFEFRFEYLESGDIIVNCNTESGEVTDAQVMVYAGNETLLISNANGTYQILKGNSAKLQLWKSFLNSNELFFALRPSQVADLKAAHIWDEGTIAKAPTCAADGLMKFTCLDCGATKTKVLKKTDEHDWDETAVDNKNGTHTLTCTVCEQTKAEDHIRNDDGTACIVCGAALKEVEYALTEDQREALQAVSYTTGDLTGTTNIRQAPLYYADTIYAAIGLDGLIEKFNGGLTAISALSQGFKMIKGTSYDFGNYDRDFVLRTEENGYLAASYTLYVPHMVIDGFYGGPWIVDDAGNRLTDKGAEVKISDLQPGDVIVLGENTADQQAVMWSVVYRGQKDGEHVFLLGATYYCGAGMYANAAKNSYYRGYLKFDAQTNLMTAAVFNPARSGAGYTVDLAMAKGVGECSFNDFLMNDPVSGTQWEYFYAIRPGLLLNN